MKGRMVVVTGAAKGVGRETVNALVRDHGCTVLAVSRNGDALAELANSLGEAVRPLPLDLTDKDAPDRLLEALGGSRVHALVHNAGALLRSEFGAYTLKDLEGLYAINVHAPLLITQALTDLLSGDPPGHVIHIGSMGGSQDSVKFAGLVGYSSSKAALACMAQCLAEELKDRDVRSNCLALGSVDTEMLRLAFPGYHAPVSAGSMGAYVARFALEGHLLYNGKVLQVAVSTP